MPGPGPARGASVRHFPVSLPVNNQEGGRKQSSSVSIPEIPVFSVTRTRHAKVCSTNRCADRCPDTDRISMINSSGVAIARILHVLVVRYRDLAIASSEHEVGTIYFHVIPDISTTAVHDKRRSTARAPLLDSPSFYGRGRTPSAYGVGSERRGHVARLSQPCPC